MHPFHLAIQVRDIPEARHFYGELLGLDEGRSSERWVDYDFYGHQLVVHLNPELGPDGRVGGAANAVDGHGVPVPHFGVVLHFEEWEKTAKRLRKSVDSFIIEPYVRFRGESGEQGTLFFADPSGNVIEIKGFRDRDTQLFAR